ncbi:MAG TPA: xanthine dehydrogenase family protein subunit M [Symbiobacteriaceae bacterium]|nr:xanthine dehydrogenase family protein subunit M [Symbiobacteriaceae bacterium]
MSHDCTAWEQTSTRLLAPEFEYMEATSRDEALRLLATDANIRVLAGGTDLLVKMKTGSVAPNRLLSISGAADLNFVETDDGLRIGAVTPLIAVEETPAVRSGYTALYEALAAMAGPAIRSMGTLGGNLCNASPAADTSPALMALGAVAVAERVGEYRSIPVDELFAGPGRTVLLRDELLTEIWVPDPGPHSGSAYTKVARVSGDIAKVNAAVFVRREGGICAEVRIALGAVAPTTVRARGAEALIQGEVLSLSLVQSAAAMAARDIQPITDLRSTAAYRKAMTEVIVEQLLIAAWARSGGEPLA